MSNETIDTSRLTLYHLVLFQAGTGDRSTINRRVVDLIQMHLDATVSTPPESTMIDIWVDSPGGDAHAAYNTKSG